MARDIQNDIRPDLLPVRDGGYALSKLDQAFRCSLAVVFNMSFQMRLVVAPNDSTPIAPRLWPFPDRWR